MNDTSCFTAQTELAAASFYWKYVYVALLDLLDRLLTLPEGEGGGEQRVKFDFPCSAHQLVAAAAPSVSSRYCF
jgi:hypothetical protein